MARRQSQELGLARGPSDQNIAQFQGGGYRPQDAGGNEPSAVDNALAGIMSIGEDVGKNLFMESAEDAYLKGGIAAATGQSQADVNSDPFVAPFVNGGYNDENYRIVQTKETSSFKNWLEKEGHQYAPDDPRVTEALAKVNQNTMAAMTPGMTHRGRAQALMSQNKTNETLITQHNKAYKEWSVAEAARRYRPQGNQILTTLANAMTSNDHATYMAATDKAALYYTDISNDPTLPEDMRQEMGTNFLLAAINADQRLPVEEMRSSGLLDKLPFEMREKVDTELRNSKNRTEVKDLSQNLAQMAVFEHGAEQGKYTTPQVEAYIQRIQAVAPQYMTMNKALSLLDNTSKSTSNKPKTADVLAALNARDTRALYATGATLPEGLDILDQQLRLNKVPDAERVATLTGIGIQMGHIPKTNAEVIGYAVRALGAAKEGEPINPDYANTLNLVTSMIDVGDKSAPYKTSILLENMPEDTRGAMSYVVEQAQYGVPADKALRTFWARNAEIKALPDASKQRHTEEWRKKYSDAINKEFPRGYYETLFAGLVGDAQRIDDSDVSNSTILQEVWSEMRWQERDPNNLGISEDNLVNAASATVRSRLIPITTGEDTDKARPLILGRGVDINSTFGTTDRALIGRALATAYPNANEKLQSYFMWNPVDKQVVNRQVDEFGMSHGDAVVDIVKLRDAIKTEQTTKAELQSKANFGSLKKVGDSLLVVDGRNSAGVGPNVALGMRNLLLKADPELTAEIAGLQPATIEDYPLATTQAEREVQLSLRLGNTNKSGSAKFRDTTDKALSIATRHIAPEYINVNAQSAISAAVIVEGPDTVKEVIKSATKALDTNDPEAFKRALSKISNVTLRNELTKTLPTGRNETGTDVPFSAGFSAY